MLRRGGPRKSQISVVLPILSSIFRDGGGGGSPEEKKGDFIQSQQRVLATRTPRLGPAVKAPGCKVCHKLESAIFE